MSIRINNNVIAGQAKQAWGDITGTLANQADLKTALDAKAATTRVETLETKVDTLTTQMPLKANDTAVVHKAGDTMTGALNFANNTWNNMGDDAQIGDNNVSGCICVKGKNAATGIQFNPYSGSTVQKMTIDGAGQMTITNNVTAGGSLGVNNNACKMAYNSTTEALEFTFG